MLVTVDYVNPWIAKVRQVSVLVCSERTACDPPPGGTGSAGGSVAGALTTGTPGSSLLSTTYRGYE